MAGQVAAHDLDQAKALQVVADQEQGADLPPGANGGRVVAGEGGGQVIELSGCLEGVFAAEHMEDPLSGTAAGTEGLDQLEIGIGLAIGLSGEDPLEVHGCPYSSTSCRRSARHPRDPELGGSDCDVVCTPLGYEADGTRSRLIAPKCGKRD